MGAYVYGCVYTILFVLLGKLFMETFGCSCRFENRWIRCCLLVGLMIGMYGVSIFLNGNWIVKEVLVFTFTTLFMWGYFQQGLLRTGAFILLYQGLGFLLDYVTILMLAKCCTTITEERVSEPLVTALMGMLSQLLLLVVILFIHRHMLRKSMDMLTAVEWARFSVFPSFTVIALIALLASFGIPLTNRQKNILLVISFGLIVMNILVYYLINSILEREMRLREDQVFMERVKSETERYRDMSENYDRQRKREHEFKNQLLVIGELAKHNKTDELLQYLKDRHVEIQENTDVIDTNNVIVNSILNAKYHEARQKKIIFEMKINDLSGLRIKDEDVVLILSNLLNNAIEACEKCDRKMIRLKFIREEHQTVISVVNTLTVQPVVETGRYITSKTENAQLHGIGIENIRETVGKYGGSCVIKHDDKSFRFAIVIPNEQGADAV